MSAAFQPGLCSVTFRQLAPGRIVDLAAAAGLEAVEWGADRHVPPGALALAGEVGRRTRDAGLAVSSYGTYLAPPDLAAGAFARAAETALALGTRHLRVWPGTRGRASARYAAPERARAEASIGALAQEAAQRGVTVGLEFHPDSLTDTLESAAALIAAVRAPALTLYWQPAPGLSVDAALHQIARLGPDIAHVHVFHWDGAGNRLPLRDAHGAWHRWLAALAAATPLRWQGPRFAMLEFVAGDAPEALSGEAAALRAVLGPP